MERKGRRELEVEKESRRIVVKIAIRLGAKKDRDGERKQKEERKIALRKDPWREREGEN